MPRCLVALGSNLGDPAAALDAAITGMRRIAQPGSLCLSERHETAAVGGATGQRPFLNAVAALSVELSAPQTLAALQAIEAERSRARDRRWSARTLDLDLLLYDQEVVRTPALRVPHPRMTFRPFVLAPACEVAGDWRHPECDATLAELRDTLGAGRNAVRLIGDASGDVASWVAATRPGLPVDASEGADAPAARLTIDASPGPHPLGPCGPRLVLADCPREHWEHEVAAALECVWPSERP